MPFTSVTINTRCIKRHLSKVCVSYSVSHRDELCLVPKKIKGRYWWLFNLQNIKYLTKGGCSEIYCADWIDGCYDNWDSKNQRLNRSRNKKVTLRKLQNVENANGCWFEKVLYMYTYYV